MYESIDTSMIDWSRAQFALTAMYHWLFVPLTLGLAVIMGTMETIYYRTGNEFWKRTAKFWMKLFGINFAIGVATGLILEFQFGTNWSNYSWFVGDIFGAPLAIEGILAFFMEATFVAVIFFGWEKVSRKFHLASTWLTGLGATISAWWILVANSWMQYPVGMEFNPDTMRNEMVDFMSVAFSPVAVVKFFHTVLSSWVLGAVFVVGVSSWYLLKKREKEFALSSIKVASAVGLFAALVTSATGDQSAYQVAQVQPMKLATMEALYDGSKEAPLTVVGPIEIPKMLSFLATHSTEGFVPGINDIINGGYTLNDGTIALSVDEKISRGKQAISALADYRQARKDKDESKAQLSLQILKENMPYFGYGYIKDTSTLIPDVNLMFWSFRVMVGLGVFFIGLFALLLLLTLKKCKYSDMRWLQIISLLSIPLAYIASQAGWIVAEVGRQPWTIQDMLPVDAAISKLETGSVQTTFFIFLIMFTMLLIAEIGIMVKAIKKGPEE